MRATRFLLSLLAAAWFAAQAAASAGGAPVTLLELASTPLTQHTRFATAARTLPVAEELVVRLETGQPLPDEEADGSVAALAFAAQPREAKLSAAYAALGGFYSAVLRHEESAAAYTRAAELDPSAPELWADAGIEYSALGADDAAEAAFERALGDDASGRGQARSQAAFHFLAAANHPQVLRIADEQAKSGDRDRDDYITLYGVVATRATSADVEAFLARRGFSERVDARGPSWVPTLTLFASGRISEAELVDRLVQDGDGEGVDRDRLCEALYFAAAVREAEGRTREAVAYYRASVATGVVDYLEYHGARRALRRLGEAPADAASPGRD